MERNFDEWLKGFRTSIADYKYYVDFDKVYNNVEEINKRSDYNIFDRFLDLLYRRVYY